MSSAPALFEPPICRDMKVLDRDRFSKTIRLAAAQIQPRQIPQFQKQCDADVLKQARLRAIYDRGGQKLIVLRPEIRVNDTSQLHPHTREHLKAEKIDLVDFDLDLSYEYWRADDILSAILPEDLIEDSPAGFSMVGHIAHMNLRDEYLPYKYIIGQVILDKNTAIRTVVNKLDTIDSVYRNFEMEVIAGEKDFLTEHFESGCKFRFDFSKVYWNSRLHTEHDRLIQLFKEGEAVCDVMAGVGPFAIPAAKKKVIVFANDLNPASFSALQDNVGLNGVSDFVKTSNLDGRQCIRESLLRLNHLRQAKGHIMIHPKAPPRKKARSQGRQGLNEQSISIPHTFQHYVMNLPATAIEFLDAFQGLYAEESRDLPLPTIHVHCFTKFTLESEAFEDMTARIGTALGHDMSQERIHFHHVRRVAPKKDMYCCSFPLPARVAFTPLATRT